MSTLYDQFLKGEKEHPHSLALRFEGRKWSYCQLLNHIDVAARRLVSLGVKVGDPVAIAMPNCPEAIYLFYAVSKIGAISHNIHPLTPPENMKNLLSRSGSRILFCLSNSCYSYRRVLPSEIEIVAVNPYRFINIPKAVVLRKMSKMGPGISSYWRIKKAKIAKAVERQDEDDAIYLNTGGTNGEPKIVRLSNVSINNLAWKGYPLVGGDVKNIKMLTAIPLFHGFGLAMGVHTPLSIGGSTILLLKFNTKEAIRYIRKGQSTNIIGVPALYNALLSRDSFYGPWLKKQEIAFVGGDCVPSSLLKKWNETMDKYSSPARLYEGYGLTETVNVTNVNTKANNKPGTIGRPLPGISEKIVDPSTGKELPFDTAGEILIAGDCLMNGYLHDEELTEKSMFYLDGVKYFKTEDFGSIDKDGYLTFKQRLRRIVKVNGETLCPSDLEDVTLSLYDIFEAYAWGVKDEKKGHVLRLAAVIRRSNNQPSESKVEEEIRQAVKEKLPPAYMPDKIIFFKKLPRTPIGKIDNAFFKEEQKD